MSLESGNARFWGRGRYVRAYAVRELRPPEVLLLVRHREAFSGRVLELGCGAGRVSGYLAGLARAFHGVDLSPAMVDYCRRRYPRGTYEVRDLRDLAGFGDDSFDGVFAADNVLDVLDDPERRRVLGELARLLSPAGVIVFSSHNRAHVPLIRRPTAVVPTSNPVRLARRLAAVPPSVANRRRLAPLERHEEGYAIVNDDAHRFRLLHYYVGRDAQERQLAETGLELLQCLDLDGETVAAGEEAAASSSLHYAARRREPGG